MIVLLLAVLLTFLTVVFHSVGTHLALTLGARWTRCVARRGSFPAAGPMAALVVLLLITHLAEAAVWAISYQRLALPDFATAFYFSLTSYSTVGYGDVVLPPPARMLGTVESIVGVLMLGWSTAVIVAVVQDAYSGSLRQRCSAKDR